jgi:hypothetical protein
VVLAAMPMPARILLAVAAVVAVVDSLKPRWQYRPIRSTICRLALVVIATAIVGVVLRQLVGAHLTFQ